MTLTGGLALAACLLLPAWFEYQVARQEYAAALQRRAELRSRSEAVERQIEHLQRDVAYLERVYRREFGSAPPGTDALGIQRAEAAPWPEPRQPEPATASARESGAGRRRPEDSATMSGEMEHPGGTPSGLDEVSQLVEQAVRRYPLIWIFVLDSTRPAVMIAAGVLVLAALVLLSRTPANPESERAADGAR